MCESYFLTCLVSFLVQQNYVMKLFVCMSLTYDDVSSQ